MSRQYTNAGFVVQAVQVDGKSFKTVCHGLRSMSKLDYALASQTLKYASIINRIISLSSSKTENYHQNDIFGDLHYGILRVMLYDLLFGSKKINGGGTIKKKILSVEVVIQEALHEMMDEKGVTKYEDLLSDFAKTNSTLPRYIRVNTLKINNCEGLEYIQEKYPNSLKDDLIPSLVSLPSDTKDLCSNSLVKEGKLIIQDKASCFPSQILFDAWEDLSRNGGRKEGKIIDACAGKSLNKQTINNIIAVFTYFVHIITFIN